MVSNPCLTLSVEEISDGTAQPAHLRPRAPMVPRVTCPSLPFDVEEISEQNKMRIPPSAPAEVAPRIHVLLHSTSSIEEMREIRYASDRTFLDDKRRAKCADKLRLARAQIPRRTTRRERAAAALAALLRCARGSAVRSRRARARAGACARAPRCRPRRPGPASCALRRSRCSLHAPLRLLAVRGAGERCALRAASFAQGERARRARRSQLVERDRTHSAPGYTMSMYHPPGCSELMRLFVQFELKRSRSYRQL
jgi:hypothetical protein